MKYAKLINGYPVFAPNKVILENVQIYNAPVEILVNLGYFPVYETDPPECEDGYYAVPMWKQENDKIIEDWSIVEADADFEDYEHALENLGVELNEEEET